MSDPELFQIIQEDEDNELNPMKMEKIEVFMNKSGSISIKQESEIDDEFTQLIIIHPAQVPLLCKWLTNLVSTQESG